MTNYFECNLPKTAPHVQDEPLRAMYEETVKEIYARTEKLNQALELSQLMPDTFHDFAAKLFSMNPYHFDQMSAREISDFTVLLYDGTEAPMRLEWPNATVLFDTAFATVGDWECLRHIGIGGSDSSVVMGVSPYTTARKLYHDKVGTELYEDAKASQAVFDRGHAIEPHVIEAFCHTTGATRVPETRMFASKRFPHSTANIDAIVRFPNGELYVFEAKTAVEEARKKWTGDKVPRHYITQCHQYPAVLDDDRIKGTYISCMFTVDYSVAGMFIDATFDGHRNITRFVPRDENAEQAILETEDDFWKDYIEAGIEPELGEPALELELETRLAGPANPQSSHVPLSNRLLGTVEEYEELESKKKALKDKITAIEDEQTALRVELIHSLGQEVEGRIEISDKEYWEIKFAPTKKSPVCDLAALALGYPEAYANCVNDSGVGSRRFSIKKKTAKAAR